MLARIERLKREIERLKKLAVACDDEIAAQFLTLTRDMQHLVDQLENDARDLAARNRTESAAD
jgi:hypothetical protein